MQDNKRIKLYLENMPLLKDEKLKLNELSPLTKAGMIQGLVMAAITIAVNLVAYLGMFWAFKLTSKAEPKLSKKLQVVLGSKKQWTVVSVNHRIPNAMTLGRNFIIVTRGLYKILDDDEIMSVLIHEAGHNYGKHVEKNLAAIGTFALIAGQVAGFTLISTYMVLGPLAGTLALLVYFILLNAPLHLYNITYGRKHEYFSDSYAAKYGYGDQIISALTKLDKWVSLEMKKRPCGPECKRQIEISQKMDEHPVLKDRVENILKTKADLLVKAMSSSKNLKTFLFKEMGINK